MFEMCIKIIYQMNKNTTHYKYFLKNKSCTNQLLRFNNLHSESSTHICEYNF